MVMSHPRQAFRLELASKNHVSTTYRTFFSSDYFSMHSNYELRPWELSACSRNQKAFTVIAGRVPPRMSHQPSGPIDNGRLGCPSTCGNNSHTLVSLMGVTLYKADFPK